MTAIEEITQIINWIEKHSVIGGTLTGCVGYTAKGILTFLTRKKTYISPVFWSFGKKYYILAVHKFTPDDSPSGFSYKQYSGEHNWGKLIKVRSTFFDCRHHVIPLHKNDKLEVVISKNGTEAYQNIRFNRH